MAQSMWGPSVVDRGWGSEGSAGNRRQEEGRDGNSALGRRAGSRMVHQKGRQWPSVLLTTTPSLPSPPGLGANLRGAGALPFHRSFDCVFIQFTTNHGPSTKVWTNPNINTATGFSASFFSASLSSYPCPFSYRTLRFAFFLFGLFDLFFALDQK